MSRIVELDVIDVRFPTSRTLDGSDAMNPDPDYSAAYVILRTDAGDGLEGHGLTFTIGRGTEVVVAARRGPAAARRRPRPRRSSPTWAGSGATLVGDSQLRWIGPEKGVIHLATAAVVNAVWDLFAKTRGQAALEAGRRHDAGGAGRPRRLPVHRPTPCRREALARSNGCAPTRAREREAELRARRLPGVHDVGRLARLRRRQDPAPLPRGAGRRLDPVQDEGRGRRDDDRAPGRIIREEIGPDRMLAVDANQRWGVGEAIAWMARAGAVRPVLDRGADEPRRHPRARGDRPGRRADPGRHRRARPQPGDVQAAAPGRGDRRLPDRRVPARRGQRGRRGAAAGGRVRRAGLPARRRRRPVRAGPAPLGRRLHRASAGRSRAG